MLRAVKTDIAGQPGGLQPTAALSRPILTSATAPAIELGDLSNDEEWRPEMAWTTPHYSKNKVNAAGEALVEPAPIGDNIAYDIWLGEYGDALDIINNWRSAHNFPLNTFHIGLRRRAQIIDRNCITAQRIKRLSSIELKLKRFETMTLSQMQDIGGCRAILSSVGQVNKLRSAYAESEIKHQLHQEDNYITSPKESGYRGIHLIYRYYSDKKKDYNSLKIEIQMRSQLQHLWATAVETVGTFVQQALKSSLGEQDWLRFFSLMGGAIAIREDSPPVPNTPDTTAALVQELREHARLLDVQNRLTAFGTALNVFENQQSKKNHYYLVEVNHHSKQVTVTGFKQAESEIATNKYLEAEKKVRNMPNADAVLVSVNSMDALRRAYPNYFMDSSMFVGLLNETLKEKPFSRKSSRIRGATPN
jgi:hypothetical protein